MGKRVMEILDKTIQEQAYEIKDIINAHNHKSYLNEEIIKVYYSHIVQPGDNVIDGGASNGMHTYPLSKLVGNDGKVFAIEPLPLRFQTLREKSENTFKNVIPLEIALCSRKGRSKYYVYEIDGYSGFAKRPDCDKDKYKEITVKKDRIDNLTKNLDNLSFIKLDLEGGERNAVIGASETIDKFKPLIIFEYGGNFSADYFSYDNEEYLNYYYNKDYELYDILGFDLRKTFVWDGVAVPKGSKTGEIFKKLAKEVLTDIINHPTDCVDIIKSKIKHVEE